MWFRHGILLTALVILAVNASVSPRDRDKQQILEPALSSHHGDNMGAMAAAPPRDPSTGKIPLPLDRRPWIVTCDSAAQNHGCNSMIDGNKTTYWQAQSRSTSQNVRINLGQPFNIAGIAVLPRQGPAPNDLITVHEIRLSDNGKDWSAPVAYGTWFNDVEEKFAVFEPTKAQHVLLQARYEAPGGISSVSEINIYAATNARAPGLGQGKWGPTLDFPSVPAGAWVDPSSGKIVTFSSFAHDRFGNPPPPGRQIGVTFTSTWDPATKQITQRSVTHTGHDMFCPGMSFDEIGRMVVTGGNSAAKTSIYAPNSGGAEFWLSGPDMKIPRGYQSSVTCDDGRIFVIGGSYALGPNNDGPGKKCARKNAEVYDPIAKTWTALPQSPVGPMLTREGKPTDGCPTFRSDNHGWLFPWKQNTVFQAGPSRGMNWFTASSPGGFKSVGNRSDDDDAMCGIAVMYDAAKGKILTAGGSRTYGGDPATRHSYILTIDEANSTVESSKIPPMANPRIYHNAVILPNGDTLIMGGRTRGGLFADDLAVLTPELFSVRQNRWVPLAPHATVRVYHSIALLLPDATVLVGGGGLCQDPCGVNHFDAQIYTPPYLFTKSGAIAIRPKITSISSPSAIAGAVLTINTEQPVTSASLVRYGSTTHGLNSDQRRIALDLMRKTETQYQVQIPGDYGIAPPGYYMLFVIDSSDVPSVATKLQIKLK